MNRLPCCDRTTRRSEVAVFLSLGLAGAMMVAMAATQMTRFVAGSDRIAASLAAQSSPALGGAHTAAGRRPMTNAQASAPALGGAMHRSAGGLAAAAPRPRWR